MNIAVLMWYDDNIKSYADIFYKINTKYCEKHGYTIIKSSERTYTDRKATWARFPLVLEEIERYDSVMWIDADAFFYLVCPCLENIIIKYNNGFRFEDLAKHYSMDTNANLVGYLGWVTEGNLHHDFEANGLNNSY